MKKFGIVLAGCGVYDGAEIHEAVMSMLAVKKLGAEYQIFAPDIMQMHVVNHYSGTPTNETRNVLIESARIARGNILPLDNLNIREFDALLFPGGFGVAKNFCNYAVKGSECEVIPPIATLIRETVSLRKPIGALCISPVLLARILGDVTITVGPNETDAVQVLAMGANHVVTRHGEVIVDEKYRLFTTPCYQLQSDIVQVAEGAENLVRKIMEVI